MSDGWELLLRMVYQYDIDTARFTPYAPEGASAVLATDGGIKVFCVLYEPKDIEELWAAIKEMKKKEEDGTLMRFHIEGHHRGRHKNGNYKRSSNKLCKDNREDNRAAEE